MALHFWCFDIQGFDCLVQAISSTGDAEKFLWRRKDSLVAALASVLKRKQVKNVQELIALYQTPGLSLFFHK